MAKLAEHECVSRNIKTVMVGGAPYLMPDLTNFLHGFGFRVVFSFSVRKSVEKINPDGTVSKMSVFSHAGWIG